MPVPADIDDLDTNPALNDPPGSDDVFPGLDDHLRFAYSCIARLRDGGAMFTQSGTGAVARTSLTKMRERVTPQDFGVDDTGVASADTAFADWLTRIAGKSGRVPAGTYRLTAGNLAVPANTTILIDDGAVFDISGAASGAAVFSASGTFGTEYPLTVNAAAGATSLTLSVSDAANLAADDWVQVYSDTVYDAGWSAAYIGEYVQVSVVAGGAVNLKSPLAGGAYTTAASAKVRKVTFVEGIRIEGGRVVGSSTAATLHAAVAFDAAKDCLVIGMRARYCNGNAFEVRNSIGVRIDAPTVEDALNSSTGYGVNFISCCQDCTVTDGVFRRVRHAVTNTAGSSDRGICRRITYENCKSYDTINSGDAFDTHSNAEDIHFINCVSYDSSASGFNVECRSATLVGCRAIRATTGFNVALGATIELSEVTLDGCVANHCTTHGYSLRPASTLNSTSTGPLVLDGCKAMNCTSSGLITGNSTSGATAMVISDLTVSGGSYNANGTGGSIFIQYDTRDFRLVGAAAYANAVNASAIQCRGSYGSIDSCSTIYSVTGANGTSSSACIRLTDASNISLSNNVGRQPSSSGGWGIRTTGTFSNIYVGAGNNFSDCTNDGAHTASLTIASGVVTLPHGGDLLVTLDTEGAAAADDLDTINGGRPGQRITIIQAASTRDPTLKDGTGNLRLAGDCTLDALHDSASLVCSGGTIWIEQSRANNA